MTKFKYIAFLAAIAVTNAKASEPESILCFAERINASVSVVCLAKPETPVYLALAIGGVVHTPERQAKLEMLAAHSYALIDVSGSAADFALNSCKDRRYCGTSSMGWQGYSVSWADMPEGRVTAWAGSDPARLQPVYRQVVIEDARVPVKSWGGEQWLQR